MGEFKHLAEDWKNIDRISIYGFGRISQGVIDIFIDYFHVDEIIDNDKKLAGTEYRNIPILSFEQFKRKHSDNKLVVLSGNRTYKAISKMLSESGLEEHKDYCSVLCFLDDWFGNYKGKICVGRITVSVTTYCTLNCRKCNMFQPYNHNKRYFDLELLKKDADCLFDFVDYVSNLVVVGGEPLLYAELDKYIRYVSERYGKRIGNLQIITNGTLTLDESLIECVKKYNVEIRISDYSKNVHYEDKVQMLKGQLKEHNIKYVSFDQEYWFDMGFPEQKQPISKDENMLRDHMMSCQPMCQELHNGKLYFCVSAWGAEESGLFTLKNEDVFELDKKKNNRSDFLSFYFGSFPNGYMSFCKVCRGMGEWNDWVIRSAEQM